MINLLIPSGIFSDWSKDLCEKTQGNHFITIPMLTTIRSGKDWFGPDGHMNNEPDPLKIVNERFSHWYDETNGGFLRTHFVEPTILPTQQMHLPVGDRLFQLDLDVIGKLYLSIFLCSNNLQKYNFMTTRCSARRI